MNWETIRKFRRKFPAPVKSAYAALIVPTLFGIVGCSSTVPRKEPTKQLFPQVRASSLDGTPISLPDDLKGSPAILLIGYAQNAQFDIDRWILGLKQLDNKVKILEVPTIKGMLPGMAANFIDSGMRRGIPREDWSSVVTVYSDAAAIVNLTGNENPNNTRVFLLDRSGNIAWFFDRGYSADKVMELHTASRE